MSASNDLSIVRFEDDSTTVTMTIDAPTNGWLVLADTYYPGWQCTVNDQPASIEPAHGVFRAVPIPQGRREVVFVFAPASVRVGLMGSTVGLVIWSALLALARLRR
jgi:uncharacterized membrane protein YfhO